MKKKPKGVSAYTVTRRDGEKQLKKRNESPYPDTCPKCGNKEFTPHEDGWQCNTCFYIIYRKTSTDTSVLGEYDTALSGREKGRKGKQVFRVNQESHPKDDGCEYGLHCCNCRFPVCLDDMARNEKIAFKSVMRDDKMTVSYWRGERTIKELARDYETSESTVRRRIARISKLTKALKVNRS